MKNHVSKVCENRGVDEVHTLMAHVHYDAPTDRYTSSTKDVTELPATVNLATASNKQHHKSKLTIFPDSGASICLAGPEHLQTMGFTSKDLKPCIKRVTAVGGSKLMCYGWILVKFNIFGRVTTQPVYFCDKVDRFYFSRQACTEVKIIHKNFPYPYDMEEGEVAATQDQEVPAQGQETSTPPSLIPERPPNLPFPPTEENVPKLTQYLKDKWYNTAFNKAQYPFPDMNTPQGRFHLKKTAVSRTVHTPFLVPVNIQDEIKRDMDEDVKRKIIREGPYHEPSE